MSINCYCKSVPSLYRCSFKTRDVGVALCIIDKRFIPRQIFQIEKVVQKCKFWISDPKREAASPLHKKGLLRVILHQIQIIFLGLTYDLTNMQGTATEYVLPQHTLLLTHFLYLFLFISLLSSFLSIFSPCHLKIVTELRAKGEIDRTKFCGKIWGPYI